MDLSSLWMALNLLATALPVVLLTILIMIDRTRSRRPRNDFERDYDDGPR